MESLDPLIVNNDSQILRLLRHSVTPFLSLEILVGFK